MKQALRETLGKAAHAAMGHYFHHKAPYLYPDDYVWETLDKETQELYRCEGEAVIKAFCEREDYKALRNEATQTIYALLKNQQGDVDASAIVHLGMFMAWSGGASEE